VPVAVRPKRVFEAALAATLVASLAGNWALGRQALRYYEDEMAVRLDPAGLEVHAGEREPGVGPPLLVLFGDSRVAMWPTPSGVRRYRIVNSGVGYQTTAQLLERIDRDVLALHPSVVVLEAGVNDLRAIASFPERRDAIVSGCKANLARIVRRCRELGARVVVLTVFDLGDVPLWRQPFWSSAVAPAVTEVNAYLETLAGDGVVLFDANPVLTRGRGVIDPAYQLDHLHLNPAGYVALNEQFVRFLATSPALAGGTAQAGGAPADDTP
jgi:lysophospholipase L1-like esterase